nr:biotin/lipoyl-containing protein [uncultured Gellertiella sp.]
MDLTLIETLLRLLDASTAEELEVSENGTTIRIARHRTRTEAPPAPKAVVSERKPAAAATGPAPALPAPELEILAGMTGLFYRSPAPGAPAFVEPGRRVRDGQTLGLLEAMKTFNPVEAECDGEIIAILAVDGSLVEAGTPLFAIRRTVP